MDFSQWIPPLASVVVVLSGMVFFGYGIFRERMKAARENEQSMISALNRQSDSIDLMREAIDRGFQRIRADAMKEENDALKRENEALRRHQS